MKVVILAAGRGKRMGEWTEAKTKAMLPIKVHENVGVNRINCVVDKPMLQVTIERCVDVGLTEFVIVVGYRKKDIIDHFGDGSKYGASIKYVTQKNVCAGTADAVGCASFCFDGHDYVDEATAFMLIYADVVPTTSDITHIFNCYVKSEQKISGVMAVRTVEDPQRYGVVEVDDNQKILRIVEKSPNPPTNLINAGIYVLPVDVFRHIKKTPLSERGEYELTESIQMFINEGNEMKVQPVTGLEDIGTKQIYELFQKKLAKTC